MDEWCTTLRSPLADAPLPFTGGWLLYLGYELVSEIEPRLSLPRSPDGITALAMRTPAAWIRDRATQQAWLVAEPGAEALLDIFERDVRSAGGSAPPRIVDAIRTVMHEAHHEGTVTSEIDERESPVRELDEHERSMRAGKGREKHAGAARSRGVGLREVDECESPVPELDEHERSMRAGKGREKHAGEARSRGVGLREVDERESPVNEVVECDTPERGSAELEAHFGAVEPRFEVMEEEPGRFLDAVRRSLEYIAAGDIYQANLSRQWRVAADRPLDPVWLYRRLRSANPSPFAALMRYGDFALMSSSPERLLSIRGGIVSTRPIAGTRPRGSSPETDAALVDSLLSNDKERAEHVMLVDLERNDIGRVCVGGSVRVDDYMVLETYAHVHHLVSNVSGRLRDDVSPVQVIRALFPGGTITGVPKVRCMEIIAELEGAGRGAYTGSLGYLNRDGSCDLNILIRTLSAQGSAVRFRAGAGIVADSVPAQELAETRAKAKGLLRALDGGD